MKKTVLIWILGVLCCSIAYGVMAADSTISATTSVLDKAISWMHDNGLTIYSTAATFKSTTWLRRDEAAKFFVEFAKIAGKTGYVKTDSQCAFSDISKSWSDLKGTVIESCKLWLFQWTKGIFNPQNKLTNEQAIAVLVRLIAGNQSESWVNRRSDNYYKIANSLNLLSNVSMTSQKLTATRGNVAIIIYNGRNNTGSNWWTSTSNSSSSNSNSSSSNSSSSSSNSSSSSSNSSSNSNGGITLNNNWTIDTSNWTSYSSSTLWISFKYPSTFTVKEQAFWVIVSDNKTNGSSVVIGKDSTFAAWDDAWAVHNFAGYACLFFDVGTYGYGYATKYNNMYYTFRATVNTSNSLLDAFMSTIKIN